MKYNILIVENQNDISEAVTEYFARENYNFHTANNEFEPKEYFLNHVCNLVLFDTSTFEDESFEALKNIREISNIPVIIFTENQNEKNMLKAFDNGADDYIVKPFKPKALIRRIKVMFKRTYKDLSI